MLHMRLMCYMKTLLPDAKTVQEYGHMTFVLLCDVLLLERRSA